MKLTQARAYEIVKQAREQAVHGPWCDQLDKVMTKEEREQVNLHWDTLDGSTSFVNALYDFVEGRVDKEYTYPVPESGYAYVAANTVKYQLIWQHGWDTEVITPTGQEKWLGTHYIDGIRYNVWESTERNCYFAQKRL